MPRGLTCCLLILCSLSLSGCAAFFGPVPGANALQMPVPPADAPRELEKVVLPDYVLEPPDVLLVDLIRGNPLPPHLLVPNDLILASIEGLPEAAPIIPPQDPNAPPSNTVGLVVQPGGIIDLGRYGTTSVQGMTVDEAKEVVNEHLRQQVPTADVAVFTLQSSQDVIQQINGEHMIGPDGTVTLGSYGQVFVAGMTRGQAKQVIEEHLGHELENVEVSVDVFAYNSKVYYVIAEGSAAGDGVYRRPFTGNETVLDAISQIEGLLPQSSKKVWIARPAPAGEMRQQLMPVDWLAITRGGATFTNYQILPGDRIFIAEDRWFTTDAIVAKITSPFERVFGTTLLGTQTVSRIKFFDQFGQTGGLGF
ncbi:MAG: polysaccharide biosynthesis/export family protein [Pirellulales bacterium]|nr:polysaccharide biosynthesis/export family protein [Pirellulales bacterium]